MRPESWAPGAMRTWALLLAYSMVAHAARAMRKINRERSSSTHIAGVRVHNYASIHELGRSHFLTSVKGDITKGREHWILSMRRGLSAKELDSDSQRKGVTMFDVADPWPLMEFRGTEEELTELLQNIGSDVEAVEPDLQTQLGDHQYVLPEPQTTKTTTLVAAPNQPNNDPICQWNMRLIGLDHRKNTGKGVHVYVLDTGIRTAHEEFEGRAQAMWQTECNEHMCWPLDCTNHITKDCDKDGNGHGTHVAGIIGGLRYGVAPEATVHSLKVLNGDGIGAVSWTIHALRHLFNAGQHPGVVSMSLGTAYQSPELSHRVELLINQGITVVVAAGNRNSDACDSTPANVRTAITVGSMFVSEKPWDSGSIEHKSSYSNHGPCVDLYAPGEVIMAAYNGDDHDFAFLTGTSMACAHETGATALALEEELCDFGGIGMPPADCVKQRMISDYTEEGLMDDIPFNTANRRLKIGPSGPSCNSDESVARSTGLIALPALLAFLVWQSF